MFNESVAQKPTTAVSAGKKNLKNEAVSLNFEGACKIGPRPFAATTAQQNNAMAASGKKMALNTKQFSNAFHAFINNEHIQQPER